MKYKNLLKPLTIGDVTLKNRISSPDCALHMLQGPETFPADGYRTWIIQMAKSCAYMITNPWDNENQRTMGADDSVRMQYFDIRDPSVTNYMSKMCDDIHFYGSKILLSIIPFEFPWPKGYDMNGPAGSPMFMPGMFGGDDDDAGDMPPFGGAPGGAPGGMPPFGGAPGGAPSGMPPFGGAPGGAPGGMPPFGGGDDAPKFTLPGMSMEKTEMLPAERMGEMVEAYVQKAATYKTFGFDGVSIPISILIGRDQNKRTDEFGCDTPQNAARLAKMMFSAVKQRLGKDFITEAYVYGEMVNVYTKEFMAQVIKELEDVLDIVSIKESNPADNHPTGFQFTKGHHPCFQYAKAIRDIGADVIIGVNGGFQDPEELDGYLAEGLTDMISMARGLIAEEDYMEKCLSGRGEDITPCVWCNKCHGTQKAPWISFCTVNPKLGIDPMIMENLQKTIVPKKVAIVGGGPIGMRAALMAKENGHDVTIFEKTDYLGGQLYHSDFVSFKWPLRDYKNWLKAQIDKNGICVRLNTEATPELIEAEGFEAVIAATGAVPNIPKFAQDESGKLKEGLMTCLDVFGNEDKLGKRVIIVGGSETGVETGMHLCEKGHEVVVMTRQKEIAHDASKLHSITMASCTYDPVDFHQIMKPAWAKYPGFKSITRASTTEVTENSVTYTDRYGATKTIEADSVVICGGMKSLRDEAIAFYGAAPRFFMTGDCEKVANLQVGNRSAMGKVAQI